MPSVQTNQVAPLLRWYEPRQRTTDAVLIVVSGGGYGGSSITSFEVAPVRDYFLAKGMTVAALRYRYPRPMGLPKHLTAWQDAQRAVRLVRREAGRRGLDPDNIGFTGCSAGGHLAMMVAVSSQTPAYRPIDEADRLPCSVNWAIPVYPAYLLVDGADAYNVRKGNDLADALVPELAFDAATPPMCFFHGDVDQWSAMGSVRAYHKLRTMGLPAELHVMALEEHCFQSNPRPGTFAANWKDRAWEWLVSMDVVTGHPQVWREGWKPVFALWGPPLEQVADFKPGSWTLSDWGRIVLKAQTDEPLWLKAAQGDCEIDMEVKCAAQTAAVLFRPDGDAASVRVDVPDDATSAGKWSRLTVRLERGSVSAVFNGRPQSVVPAPALAGSRVRLGFEGKGAMFRNVKVKDKE